MKALLDRLQSEVGFDQMTAKVQLDTPFVFLDLCWEEPFDVLGFPEKDCVQFSTPDRYIVLMQVGDDLRYYAGTPPRSPRDDLIISEMGTFATTKEAVLFSQHYLLDGHELHLILVERTKRRLV